jgi:hypothetical protein
LPEAGAEAVEAVAAAEAVAAEAAAAEAVAVAGAAAEAAGAAAVCHGEVAASARSEHGGLTGSIHRPVCFAALHTECARQWLDDAVGVHLHLAARMLS